MQMKILIYSILLLIPTLSFGQRAKIAFEKSTFNMGLVRENGGKVTHEFKFINKGKAPLLIKFIETTCGCTTPKWNRKPIPPGDSSAITVTFNPKDRPGVFSKKLPCIQMPLLQTSFCVWKEKLYSNRLTSRQPTRSWWVTYVLPRTRST